MQENRTIENIGTLLKLAKGRVFRFSVHLTITIPQIVGWKFELREDPPARSHSEHVDNRWFLSGVLPGRLHWRKLAETWWDATHQTRFGPNQI